MLRSVPSFIVNVLLNVVQAFQDLLWILVRFVAVQLSHLESIHVMVFLAGSIVEDGAEGLITFTYGWLLVVGSMLADWSNVCRRERAYIVGFFREVTLTQLTLYLESAAVYLVAVFHTRRDENLQLQDNLLIVLEALLASCRPFECVFMGLPKFQSKEAMVYTCGIFVFGAIHGGSQFSALRCAARFGRALRYCRLLRVLCFSSTVMPSPIPNCFMNRYDETYTLSEHFREAFTHWRTGGGCNDLVFSGHVVIMTLCAHLHQDYCIDTGVGANSWLTFLLWGRVIHSCLRIVHGRFHMSVDVIVALAVSSLIWRQTPELWPDGIIFRRKVLKLPDWHPTDASTALRIRNELLGYKRLAPEIPLPLSHPAARFWILAGLLAAILSASLLILRPNDAGVLSEANMARLERVVVAGHQPVPQCPTPESSKNGTAGCGGNTTKRPRLLCAMLQIEKSWWARQSYYRETKATWAQYCDHFIAWDEYRFDVLSLESAVIQLEPLRGTTLSDRWLRARRMWRHIEKKHLADFDWVIAVDDGGFVIPQNLHLAIEAMEQIASRQGNTTPTLYLDKAELSWGYLLNAAAAWELLRAMDSPSESCPKPSKSGSNTFSCEYELVFQCLAIDRQVAVFQWDESSEVREALGCEEGDLSVINLKEQSSARSCKNAVLAYMIASPSWIPSIAKKVLLL